MSVIHKNTYRVHRSPGKPGPGLAISARRNEGAHIKHQPPPNTPMILNGTQFAEKGAAISFATQKLPIYCQIHRKGSISDIVPCNTLSELAIALQGDRPTRIVLRRIAH